MHCRQVYVDKMIFQGPVTFTSHKLEQHLSMKCLNLTVLFPKGHSV